MELWLRDESYVFDTPRKALGSLPISAKKVEKNHKQDSLILSYFNAFGNLGVVWFCFIWLLVCICMCVCVCVCSSVPLAAHLTLYHWTATRAPPTIKKEAQYLVGLFGF